jgi:hypothetical protein
VALERDRQKIGVQEGFCGGATRCDAIVRCATEPGAGSRGLSSLVLTQNRSDQALRSRRPNRPGRPESRPETRRNPGSAMRSRLRRQMSLKN